MVNVLWHNILTPLMTRIVVDKSTDHAKTYSNCFLLSCNKKGFSQRAKCQKMALRDTLTRALASCVDSCEQQISQSDCEISGNCGKTHFDMEAKGVFRATGKR